MIEDNAEALEPVQKQSLEVLVMFALASMEIRHYNWRRRFGLYQ